MNDTRFLRDITPEEADRLLSEGTDIQKTVTVFLSNLDAGDIARLINRQAAKIKKLEEQLQKSSENSELRSNQ